MTEAQKGASVRIIRGGLQHGELGLELVAIRYAAWLSPQFEIRVYETFREAVMSGITYMDQLNHLDLLTATEAEHVSGCARTMKNGGGVDASCYSTMPENALLNR